ncbi:MAG: serine/threonine-protein phosphatase [Clostridia bacterium]|nr:serine/threonine-protein phosphatase [Clostridia bacterium]
MLEYSLFTDNGSRDINEDFISVTEVDGNYCFIVCDGLGGHGKGEVASKIVAGKIADCFKKNYNSPDFLDMAMREAQKTLGEEQQKQCAFREMKTTAVVLTIVNSVARWAHIGDSRLYMFYKSKLKERTLDHSVPQMLVLAGDIKEKEIRFHPDRNKLLRAMGIEWRDTPFVVSEEVNLKEGFAFLLCTDGFWELTDEKRMRKLLHKEKNAVSWLDAMKQVIAENGYGRDNDNCSAIAVTF